jgi:hypothetical protein
MFAGHVTVARQDGLIGGGDELLKSFGPITAGLDDDGLHPKGRQLKAKFLGQGFKRCLGSRVGADERHFQIKKGRRERH